MSDSLQHALELAAAEREREVRAAMEKEPSSLYRQGSWIRLRHKGREHVVCALTVTRVDLVKSRGLTSLTLHQQGLHEWVRLADLPHDAAVAIRNEILGISEDAWA